MDILGKLDKGVTPLWVPLAISVFFPNTDSKSVTLC